MSDDSPSIVIVGNGPIKSGCGEKIDKCDIVIRFNKFVIKGYEDKVGTKTTVWSYAPHNWRGMDVHKGSTFKEIWIIKGSRINLGMIEQAEEMKAKLVKVPMWISGWTGQRFPSIGLSVIFAAIHRFQGSEIYIAGFTGGKKHYWGGYGRRGGGHDWKSEQNIIQQLIDNETIIFIHE